jgi:hypothetical protein
MNEPPTKQGRPPKSPEERRTAELRIRLTEAERELIDAICGRGASTWARDVILRAARAKIEKGQK